MHQEIAVGISVADSWHWEKHPLCLLQLMQGAWECWPGQSLLRAPELTGISLRSAERWKKIVDVVSRGIIAFPLLCPQLVMLFLLGRIKFGMRFSLGRLEKCQFAVSLQSDCYGS